MRAFRLARSISPGEEPGLSRAAKVVVVGIVLGVAMVILLHMLLHEPYPPPEMVRRHHASSQLRQVAQEMCILMEPAEDAEATPARTVEEAVHAVIAGHGVQHFKAPGYDTWIILNPSAPAWIEPTSEIVLAVAGGAGDWILVDGRGGTTRATDLQLPDWFAAGISVETMGLVASEDPEG